MHIAFYVAGLVSAVATVMVITRRNPIHALLYFILSLIGVAVVFLDLGAPFVAALEIIIYAGAIMVLFVFVIMLLSPAPSPVYRVSVWLGPAALGILLTAGLIYAVMSSGTPFGQTREIVPKEVGIALFGPYILGVEISSLLLLAGLVAAYYLGRRERDTDKEETS